MNALTLLVAATIGAEPLPHCATAAGSPFLAASQQDCSGPVLHPFQRLPRVCPVVPCLCNEGGTDGNKKPAWVQEFHHAAHFPLPRFAGDGTPIIGDGLLIYEGMRLTVYSNGVYDLSFTATVPDMPVTVRLQLGFARGKGSEVEYSLTLPPIRMEPKKGRGGDANTFHITHRGQSTLFVPKYALLPCSPIDSGWKVCRSGTARFGTPIDSDDPNR